MFGPVGCYIPEGFYLLCQFPGRSQHQSLSSLHLHINLLQDGNGKSGGLPSARLGLSDHVVTCTARMKTKHSFYPQQDDNNNLLTCTQILLPTLDTRDDGPLLDCRWLLETIGINSPEQSFAQVHVIKAVHDLVPVTLQTNQQDTFQDGDSISAADTLLPPGSDIGTLCKLAEKLGNAAPYPLKTATGRFHGGGCLVSFTKEGLDHQVLSEPPQGRPTAPEPHKNPLKIHPPHL